MPPKIWRKRERNKLIMFLNNNSVNNLMNFLL
uniref:Uncharacterized protein n=1 Tax=Anguilla anguilla TaxID=7936 RepID=A0A0E9TB12_ANGAN